VVTLCGDRHASRVGASLLGAAGLGDLVARNTDEFAEIAVRLATDRPRLADLRCTLRTRLRSSPLTDAESYSARFHALLREAWRARCPAT
jgi:predicted O-linked N-acetylglucosamine transferase (SPINDLY family)